MPGTWGHLRDDDGGQACARGALQRGASAPGHACAPAPSCVGLFTTNHRCASEGRGPVPLNPLQQAPWGLGALGSGAHPTTVPRSCPPTAPGLLSLSRISWPRACLLQAQPGSVATLRPLSLGSGHPQLPLSGQPGSPTAGQGPSDLLHLGRGVF